MSGMNCQHNVYLGDRCELCKDAEKRERATSQYMKESFMHILIIIAVAGFIFILLNMALS